MLSEIIRWRLKPKATRLPLYLVVFVTYRCNSNCRICFYHEKLNTPESADLPLEFREMRTEPLERRAIGRTATGLSALGRSRLILSFF